MDVSLKKFVEPEKNFDILDAQIGGVAYNGFKGQIRFEDIPKPTELKPLVPAPKVENKKIETTKNISAEEIATLPQKFTPPDALLTYIQKLIGTGRKLRALAFDIEFAKSNEEIKSLVKADFDKGLIAEMEKTTMLGFLVESKPVNVDMTIDTAKAERLQKLKDEHGIVVQ